MTSLICNAPFCENIRNKNHAWCSVHRWEREKFKVKPFKQIRLFNPKIIKKYKPTKQQQKFYNEKYYQKRINWRLKKRYSITDIDYESLLKEQNYSCAICKIHITEHKKIKGEKKNFAVDHCHKTSKIRGLLCYKCNMGLGYFNDDSIKLAQASAYLSVLK